MKCVTTLIQWSGRVAVARKPLTMTARTLSNISSNKPNVSSSSQPKKPEKAELADEDELEEMFVPGPHGIEWGGPTRGGKKPEPTRYGDWESKGRVIDF
jgi:hypothetical protein